MPFDPTDTASAGADRLRVARSDVQPTRRQGGEIRVLLSPRTVGSTSGFNATLTLQPEEYVATQIHPYSDKFLYLVAGTLTVRVAGEPVRLLPEQAMFVPRGTPHRIENAGTEEAYVVFSISPLAPSPELGHVDVEPVPRPDESVPHVGGPAGARP